ncbi:hypothetical protein M8494_15635 [Serratia ureilytica]
MGPNHWPPATGTTVSAASTSGAPNDYLAMSHHPKVLLATTEAVNRVRAGHLRRPQHFRHLGLPQWAGNAVGQRLRQRVGCCSPPVSAPTTPPCPPQRRHSRSDRVLRRAESRLDDLRYPLQQSGRKRSSATTTWHTLPELLRRPPIRRRPI